MRVDRDEPYPDPRDPAFAVVLGSGASAAGGGPPWVERVIEWLREADAAALPVLGICFGAQALAAALGGCVRRLRHSRGRLGDRRQRRRRAASRPGRGWPGTRTASRSRRWPTSSPRNAFGVQAFCHCRHLAVQFHPEVTPAIVRGWADDDHGDLERAGTHASRSWTPPRDRHAAAAARAAETLFDGFAARAGLVAVASRV